MFDPAAGYDQGDLEVEGALAQAIAAIDYANRSKAGYIPILSDSKISDPEFDAIIDYWGKSLGIDKALSYSELVLHDVVVEDVDNIIILELEGYYDQYYTIDQFGIRRVAGIFKDKDSDKTYDSGEEVTFNYDVPNLPMVFIDHVTITETYYHIEYTSVPYFVEAPSLLTIIAQGKDPSSALINNGRAIGSVESTHDIYSNVLIEASRGGIAEVIAAHDIGAEGSMDSITLNAKTAIDKIEAGDNLGRPGVPIVVDVDGAVSPFDIFNAVLTGNVTGTLANNGVGVKGGISAGAGDISMEISTGASIGPIMAKAGSVIGSYHATGNFKGVWGSTGVNGHFVAELGSMDLAYATENGITGDFIVGGTVGQVSVLYGDIDAEIVAGKGIGIVTAPFGNISGKVYSGGNIGQIVELADATKGDVDITLKLVSGNTSYISSLRTTLALEGDGYALIKTDDYFDFKTILIRESSSDTDFVITKAGGKLELDEFDVDGDFGSLKDNKGGAADANIERVDINGTIFRTVAVDGVIGTLIAGGLDSYEGYGSVVTGLLNGTTFTYTIGGSTDTASAVGGDWRIALTEGNVISANLTKVVAPSLSFITTSSVEDLNANLSGRNLGLNIGGDVIGTVDVKAGDLDLTVGGDIAIYGKVQIHSGDLILTADDLLGSVVVTAGSVDSLTLGGKLSGSLSADAIADGLMVFNIGGNLSGNVSVLGDLDLNIGGNFGTGTSAVSLVQVRSGTLALDVEGNILKGADVKTDGGVVDFEVGGTIDSSIGKHYKLDTDSGTTNPDTLPGDATTSHQLVNIIGSSSSLVADVTVVFGSTVLDTVATGSGTLKFASIGNVRDIAVAVGSNISIASVNVQGNAGDISTAYESCTTCGQKTTVQNVQVSGMVGDITSGKLVKNVSAKSIGEIKSLFGDVMIVNVAEDIEKICALKSVQKITACGAIGDIYAGTDIKTIKAGSLGSAVAGKNIYDVNVLGDIGLLDAGSTVKKVLAAGDIGLVKAIGGISYIDAAGDIDEAVSGKNISRVAVGGKIKIMTAATNVTYISAIDGGTIYAGGYAQNCSPNLTITKVTTLL